MKDPDGKGLQTVSGGTKQERLDAMQLAVDGAAADYVEAGALTLATEKYSKDAYRVEVKVWEFANATSAASGYDYMLANANLFKATTWTSASIGDAGRIADNMTEWWVNVRKGAYIVDVSASVVITTGGITGTQSDDTAKADAQAFAQALVSKMP